MILLRVKKGERKKKRERERTEKYIRGKTYNKLGVKKN